jgi:hypothetical protein
MQSKLAMWSTENKGRKFDRLLRLIADKSWLAEAARITLASSGANTPGVDGVNKEMMEGNLHHELEAIRAELLAGSYVPLPARRVYIPKANGKLRPLASICRTNTNKVVVVRTTCSSGQADGVERVMEFFAQLNVMLVQGADALWGAAVGTYHTSQ